MKTNVIVFCVLLSLIPSLVYSQGTTCATATPFCTAIGTPFTYVNSTSGNLNSVRCLQDTPGPNWFYVKTTSPGTYVFSITQSSTPGGSPNIDVDFIAFGPYAAAQCTFGSGGGGLTNDCSSIGTPYGEVEDCSYCWDPTETMTLRPSSSCQIFMVLVTNYSRQAGYITFTQTSGPSTDCSIISGSWTPPPPMCVDAGPIILDSLVIGTSTGTWSGTGVTGNVFDPAVSGQGSFNVTYTVAGSTCPSTEMYAITVTGPVAPAFSDVGPYCIGDTPAALPGTSTNSITGTWSPSTISTGTAGTTTYTFTPAAGQCANPQTLDITVFATGLEPDFTALGPYCVGETPATLPATSTNGLNGSWNPPAISTVATGTTTYTFTPVSSCAIPVTMNIDVTTSFTPVFDILGPYCTNETPADLPLTSNNGVTGTWAPGAIATSVPGTTTYTFTSTSSLCAVNATMDVTVNALAAPDFEAIPPMCAGGFIPVLNNISPNGITGTWLPAAIDNSTTGSYVFTPDSGWCATTQTLEVTILPSNTPNFLEIPPFCTGTPSPLLETTAPNGITGAWSPSVIDNTASGAYVFTPNASSCATPQTLNVTVIALTPPEFALIPPFCAGSSQPFLKDTSLNGITGVWNPENVDNAATGTYLFTPYDGQCASLASMDVIVYPLPGDGQIIVPNIFTPNGDHYNDVLGITGIDNFPNSSLTVFNRWGKKVFESGDYDCNQNADGSISGNNCWDGGISACGVYFYVLTVNYEKYKECSEGNVEYHGIFTIAK